MIKIATGLTLPWSRSEGNSVFYTMLAGFTVLYAVVVYWISSTVLPPIDRTDLETLPPQLAKILERRTIVLPEPTELLEPEIAEPEIFEPELTSEPEVTSEPKVAEVEVPEVEVPDENPVEQTFEEEVSAIAKAEARSRAMSSIGADTLAALDSLSSVSDSAFATSSGGIEGYSVEEGDGSGSFTKDIQLGSGPGGIELSSISGSLGNPELTSQLAAKTSASNVKQVAAVVEELAEKTVAARTTVDTKSKNRSGEEIRSTFEQYRGQYDRIYRGALRQDPTLAGAVLVSLNILSNGAVSDCSATSNDIGDSKLLRRISMKCKQMTFLARNDIAPTQVEFPIQFTP